jgi:hypothetical protein
MCIATGVGVMNRLVLQWIALSSACRRSLGDGPFDERGVLGRRAFPADDPPSTSVTVVSHSARFDGARTAQA